MYRKLLKQEWKATRLTLLILSIVCIGAGLLGGLGLRTFIYLIDSNTDAPLWMILNFGTVFVCFMTMVICSAATLFLSLWRFYKSRYTDEGYITFTLPATTHQILLSSLSSILINSAIMLLVVLLSFSIAGLIGITAVKSELSYIAEFFLDDMGGSLRESGAGWGILLLVLYSLAAVVGNILLTMLCITLGSVLVRKLKLLAAVGIYYGCNVVLSIISTVLSFLINGASLYRGDFSFNSVYLTYGLMALLFTGLAVGCYFLMHRFASKRLNLP